MGCYTNGKGIIQDELLLYLDFFNEKSFDARTERIYDYGVLTENSTGHIGSFSDYGTADQNLRIVGTDPWKNQSILWKGYKGTTVHDPARLSEGGIYCNPVSIDPTKRYRASYWENRVTNGTATYGRYYFGCNGYGSVSGVGNLTNEDANTNPYFWSTSHNANLVENTWFLIVGHIFEHTYALTSSHAESGRYTIASGRYASNSTDYKWLPETTTGRIRTLSIYRGNTDDMIHHSFQPRFEICDGTEPSINDLLNGKVDYTSDLSNSGNSYNGYLINGPVYTDGAISLNGTNQYATLGTNSALGIDGDITISAWVKLTAFGSYYGIYGGSNENGSTRKGVTLGKWSDDKWCLFIGKNDSAYWLITANDAAELDTWYHVMGTVESGVMSLYVNNIKQTATASSVTVYPTDNDTVIGRWYGNYDGFYYNGDIATISVHNKALSVSEKEQNFNTLKNRFGL